jgi:hypothetical protein
MALLFSDISWRKVISTGRDTGGDVNLREIPGMTARP